MTKRQYYSASLVMLLCLLLSGFYGYTSRVQAREDTVKIEVLLNAQSIDETSDEVSRRSVEECRESAVYVKWSVGTSAGVVVVESADTTAYAGTWAPLATVSWSAASKQDLVQITGVHLLLRTRISTAISGGTVTTTFICN